MPKVFRIVIVFMFLYPVYIRTISYIVGFNPFRYPAYKEAPSTNHINIYKLTKLRKL